MFLMLPFASKEFPDGKKLFRRKYGYEIECPANEETSLVMVNPYAKAKINLLEILDLPQTLPIDLLIKDTPDGAYTGIANKVLNQFGFNVRASKQFYEDISQYDADLLQGMQIVLVIKNREIPFTASANVVFHEVVVPST